jgi:Domain of unknown function (DUF3883)
MHIVDDRRGILHSTFSVELFAGEQTVVLDAAWGAASRDYPTALRVLLERLQSLGAVITDAIVDSRVTRALPSHAERRLVLRNGREYPIRLTAVDDLDELRLAMGAAQEHVGQRPGAKGGNRNKRLRVMIALEDNIEAADLEGLLSGGHALAPEVEDALNASTIGAGKRAARQGFRQSAADRRAIELRAMDVAQVCLAAYGCVNITDVARSESYDFRCGLHGRELHVEVKGTTSVGDRILLTRNEVSHAREWYPDIALVVVSAIELTKDDPPVARGGSARVIHPWELDSSLEPISYECVVSPREK